MKKLYSLLLFAAIAQMSYGQLIINEVLYDPSNNALDGDANGDGIYDQDQDSFIELYNNTSAPIDISGYELWDDTTGGGNNLEFTFPSNSIIPANEAVVVFGGGTLVANFGSAVVFNADSGLNFNNSGEVIGIKDTSGAWVLLFDSDALSNNPNESYTRFPDVTGLFIQHADSTSILFSPGTRVDGTPFNTPPPPPGIANLLINEVLYDPSNNALDGDANGDGIYSQDDDSFIEIYNLDTADANISNYEIWDDTTAGTLQYIFPPNTVLPGNEVVVVFGGGTPTGTFGTSVVLNAINGFNFNNSGEVIGIKDPNGNWVLTFDSDALSNNPNEAYTRFPDVTGPFIQHSDSTSVLFSPGTKTDGTPFRNLTGITERSNPISLKLYPNPTKDVLNIDSSEKIDRIDIFNLNGAQVASFNQVSNQIDVSNLSNGLYILRLNSKSGVSTLRLIKE